MPAATSPYQNNDYQAVSSFRPYQLRINDIFKAISAQNQFWDAEAARVKSVYENALNLKLSKAPNQQIRDQFMQDAEKQITKLSAMDLSDPSVQRQGFNIFKPLFQDKGIVSDDAATRHIEKVNADATSYMRKDNGKYYSQANHQYALDGADEFMNSKDRNAGEAYLQKRKEYEPFYDYSAEYDKIIKNCPSDSEKVDSVLSDKGYIQGNSIKTRSASKVRTCMEAGLSPKAYRQMQIEGYVNYKGKPDILADDYKEFLGSSANAIQKKVQELTGELEGVTKSTKLRSEEKKAMIENYSAQLKDLDDQLINHTTSINKLNKHDYTDILNNQDAIAGSVYQYRKILKESYAAAFQDTERTYKADPVSMQRFKFQQDVQLRNVDFGHDMLLHSYDNNFKLRLADINHINDMELESMKNTSKGSSGSGSPVVFDPITRTWGVAPGISAVPAHFDTKPEENTKQYQNINDQLQSLNTLTKTNDDAVFNTFVRRGDADPAFRDRLVKAFGVRSWEEFKSTGNNINRNGNKVPITESFWFENYVKQNPNDPEIQDWNARNSEGKLAIQALKYQLEQGEAQVVRNLGIKPHPGESSVDAVKRATREQISALPTISVAGQVISPQDIQDAIEGVGSKVQIQINTGRIGPEGQRGTDTREFIVNGSPVSGKDYANVSNLFQKITKKNSDINDKLVANRKKIYSTMQFEKEPWFYNIDEKAPQVDVVKGILADDKGKDREGVKIEQLDFNGGFKMRIPNLGGAGSSDFKKIQGRFGTGFTEIDPTDEDVIVVKGAGYNQLPNGMDPIMKNAAYVLSVISKGQDFNAAKAGEKVKNSDIAFPIYDNSGINRSFTIQTIKTVEGTPKFEIIDTGTSNVRVTLTNPFEVMKYLQNLKGDPRFRTNTNK